jgi:hypothetical protein
MAEKEITVKDQITIIPDGYKIKSKGTYNLDDLYLELHLWFMHHGYEWKELEYQVISRGGGAERLEILWKGERAVDEYVNFVIRLNMAADISDAEVVLEGGKKVKRKAGAIEFKSEAYITRNTDVWEGKVLGNMQAKIYDMLTESRLSAQKGDLFAEAHKLYDELKSFMMLYR